MTGEADDANGEGFFEGAFPFILCIIIIKGEAQENASEGRKRLLNEMPRRFCVVYFVSLYVDDGRNAFLGICSKGADFSNGFCADIRLRVFGKGKQKVKGNLRGKAKSILLATFFRRHDGRRKEKRA